MRVRSERPADGVARVILARPDKHNAQDVQMLRELDAAFDDAMRDDGVKVVVLAADGVNFSSGHDLRDASSSAGLENAPHQHGMMSREEDIYLGYCWKWRNLPKVTIAQVQGKVIAGGLMLVWPCDLIIASEDATFADPVVAFGVNGHEFFTHVWELGARKAKEMLFRGLSLSASECHRLGMVNHVVPLDELETFTMGVATEIAKRPAFGLKLAKLAVNQSLDAQGQWTAIQSAFALHHLGHAQMRLEHDGSPVDPSGAAVIRGSS